MNTKFDGYKYIPGGPGPYGGADSAVISPSGERHETENFVAINSNPMRFLEKVRGKEIYVFEGQVMSQKDAIHRFAEALLAMPAAKRHVFMYGKGAGFLHPVWVNTHSAAKRERREAELEEQGYTPAGSGHVPTWVLKDDYLKSL